MTDPGTTSGDSAESTERGPDATATAEPTETAVDAEAGAAEEGPTETPQTGDDGADSRPIAENDPEELLEDGPILLFDGVCNLCNWTVQFVIRHDPEGQFRFAPLQSEAGAALLAYSDVDVAPMESFVMVDRDGVYVKSDAGLHVLKELGLPWSIAYPLVVFPRFVRNLVYDVIAANRYRVFGRKDQCMIPDEDVSDRFLE